MLYLELNVDLNISLKKKERSKNNIKNSNQWPLQKKNNSEFPSLLQELKTNSSVKLFYKKPVT